MPGCAAIILAGGSSSRLGPPKQLLAFEGEPLLARTVRTALASQAHPVVVVLGAFADECAPLLANQPVRIAKNPSWREGVASSIRAGVENIRDEADGTVILLCDQPRLTARVIDETISTGKPMAACSYGGAFGPPVYFARRFFDELLALRGDRGGKHLLEKFAGEVASVPFPDGVLDIDTPDDLNTLAQSNA